MRASDDRGVWLSVMLLMVSIVSIQVGAAFAKRLLPELGAAGTATLRLCFASLILSMVFRPWRARLDLHSLRVIGMYGLTIGCMNFFIYSALRHIPLGVAVALEFLGPLGVAVLASRKRLDFLWVGLAAIGVALLLPKSDTQAAFNWQGIAFALGAAICWALYIVIGQRAGNMASSGTVTTIGMLAATFAIAPIGVATTGAKLLNAQHWPLALSIALLSSALPYYLEMIALKTLPARTFGILMSLEPAIAALSGLVILREYLSSTQWLAIVAIMLASLGSVFSAKSAKASPELNV